MTDFRDPTGFDYKTIEDTIRKIYPNPTDSVRRVNITGNENVNIGPEQLKRIMRDWDSFSPRMQNIMITKYGISPGGYIPEEYIPTARSSFVDRQKQLVDDYDINNPPGGNDPPTPKIPNIPGNQPQDLQLQEFFNNLGDSLSSSVDETAPIVDQYAPEPQNIDAKFNPIEMIALKIKSPRLWSYRKLWPHAFHQILELYEHYYDSMYNNMLFIGERTAVNENQRFQRQNRRTSLRKFPKKSKRHAWRS